LIAATISALWATLTATARIGNDVLHLNGMGAFTTYVTVEAHYTLSEATS